MYGQGHRYCPSCGHAIHRNAGGCRSCGAGLADLMLFDEAYDQQGGFGGGIGFDPMDDQFAVNIPGTDLAIEADGQVDIDLGGFDIPL